MRKIEIKTKRELKEGLRKCSTAAAVTALAALMPLTVTGCRQQTKVNATVETTLENVAETEEAAVVNRREDTLTAAGTAETMIESGKHLFFQYGGSIWSLDKTAGKLERVKTFADGEEIGSFWIYGGNLYYDVNSATGEEPNRLYTLCRLDLETGEETKLTDLADRASGIYASEGILYVSSYNMRHAYTLAEDGGLDGELAADQTVYGRIPEGCRELYRGILPFMTEHYGYMPIQNDSCLVIAKEDGTGAREVSEVTNTSSVLFEKDIFFALFQDGSGNTQCYRYDPKTLEKTIVFESSDNPQLMQYRDGFLYYMSGMVNRTAGKGTSFYKVDIKTGEISEAAAITIEPGTLNMSTYNGNFFVAEDAVYCQEIKDYGVYIGKTGLYSEEKKLLEPVLYQSPVKELGHVEAVKKEIPCACGDTTAVDVYIEMMVFDGESEAVKAMNSVMEERRQSLLQYGDEMVKYQGESEVHRADFHMTTLTYEIVGINYLDAGMVCMEADGYEYSGGAHGMPFREYFVFDRETGRQLKLKDIVENPVEELQSIVGRAFREVAEKTNFAFESPEDLEHTVSDDVSYDSEFYITPEGVVFYYTPYEIAPYAEGFPEVTIPFEELQMKYSFESEI